LCLYPLYSRFLTLRGALESVVRQLLRSKDVKEPLELQENAYGRTLLPLFVFTFSTFLQLDYPLSDRLSLMQAIRTHKVTAESREAVYNLFAAYIHTIPLEELIESVERARLDAKLRYMVIYGAACSYCLARAQRLDGSYLRTFALELKEQLAQTLATFVTSTLVEPRRRLDAESPEEPLLRQIIDVLKQVMCTHNAEKLAISVLEIYEDCHA